MFETRRADQAKLTIPTSRTLLFLSNFPHQVTTSVIAIATKMEAMTMKNSNCDMALHAAPNAQVSGVLQRALWRRKCEAAVAKRAVTRPLHLIVRLPMACLPNGCIGIGRL